MKKIFYSFPLIIILVSLFSLNTGCNKSDDTSVTPAIDDNFDKEAVSAKNFATLINVIAGANSYQWLFLNNVPSSLCPAYYYDSSYYRALAIDYGAFPGCIDKDTVKRSGVYTLSVNSFTGDSIYSTFAFPDFSVYKYPENNDTISIRFSGFLNFSSKKTSSTSYNFHTSGEAGYITIRRNTKIINLTGLHGAINYNSLTTALDDIYSVYGTATITDYEFGVSYDISISQSNPLIINGNCKYPSSGIIKLIKDGVTVECDFSPNGNACDDAIKFTRGSASKNLNLKGIDF
ncbi:MAG: hypothetical protein K1X86_00480 [Ignavibacteria bacterium]|nr:hypothetical protein [Ignavibacteria bacterium]